MEIANLDYAVVLDSTAISSRSNRSGNRSVVGGFSQIVFCSAPIDELENLDFKFAFDDDISSQSFSLDDDWFYGLGSLKTFDVSSTTSDGGNYRSIAGSGSLGNGGFSFSVSSALTSL